MHSCQNCQTETVGGANFCHRCGLLLRAYCRACRIPLPDESQCCYVCGDSLQQGNTSLMRTAQSPPSHSLSPRPAPNSSPPPPPTSTPSPQQLQNKKALPTEGERKLVSVVFADISGFTAMSEKMDPEKVTDIMNSCFDRLGQTVYEFDGFIDKFMGDCIMALFGAPVAHENDPELAINCALKILSELREFNQEHQLDLGISIGINSGVVIAGSVGTEEKREYTVMGDPVNVAQRLESAAGRNQILVSKNIHRDTEKLFEFEALAPIKVKGKDELVEVFAVLDKKDLSIADRGLTRKLHRMIGREKEIQLAEIALDKSAQGVGQILAVSGEAGVGKSRLKHEVRNSAKDRGFEWFETKCQILQRDSAYYVVKMMVDEIFHQISAPQAKIEYRPLDVLEKLALDPVSKHLIKTEILNIPDASREHQALSAEQKKKALFLGLKKLFYKLAADRPVVMYFEDLHWIDSLSKEFIHYLMDSLRTQKFLLYMGFRPEFQHDWYQLKNFNTISLEPLSAEDSVGLVKELLEIEKVPHVLAELIRKRSDGNPLYIEEILKSLVDAGALIKENQDWRIDESVLMRAEIPNTLRGLIASRLDKLDPQDKVFLQIASVIGRNFHEAILMKSVDRPELVEQTLENWRRRELVFEQESDERGCVYVFKHAMTQEVAFESILKKKRRKIHESVAQAIEKTYEQASEAEIEDQVEALSYHYSKAEISDKAVHYLKRAGDRLNNAFACADAVTKYSLAIQIQEEERKADTNYEKVLVSLYDAITQPLFLLHDFDQAEKYQRKTLRLKFTQNDLALQAKTFRILGDAVRLRGRMDEALEHLKTGIECAVQAGNHEEQFRTYKAFGNALKKSNEIAMALEYLSQAKKGAEGLGQERLVVECLNDIATVLLTRNDSKHNDLEESESRLKECIDVAKDKPELTSIRISATLNLGVVHYYRKEFDMALKNFQEAYQMAEQIGDMRNLFISKHNVGEVQKEYGDYSEALKSFEKAKEWASELGNYSERLNNQILVAYLRTKLGEEEQGEAELIESAETAEELNFNTLHCDAVQYLAKYYAEIEDYERAKETFEKALEIAERNQIKYHMGQITFELDKVKKSLSSKVKQISSKKK